MTNLSHFRLRICDNPNYLGRLLYFLDHIIITSLSVHSSDLSSAQDLGQDEFTPLPTTEHINAFRATLAADSNKVASKVQMHSPLYNASYYKYGKSGSRCHFHFPQPLVEEIHVDKYNNIHFKQNNVWVNHWNLAIALLLRSNHNITFIASANNTLALIYYITNYTTKGDISQYQRIMGAAFVKNTYDESQSPSNTTTLDTNIGLPEKFALRAFNRLAYDREISGPLVASLLLGLLEYYTMPCDVRSINIGLLRSRFSEIALGRYNHARDGDNFVVL